MQTFWEKKHGINAPPVQKLIKSFLMCVTPLLPLFAVGGSEVDVQTEHLSNKIFRIKRFPQNPEVLKIQKIPLVLVRAPTITNLKSMRMLYYAQPTIFTVFEIKSYFFPRELMNHICSTCVGGVPFGEGGEPKFLSGPTLYK